MHPTILPAFFEISRTVVSMCSAGIVLFVIALLAARTDMAQARGLDKVVALGNLCFALPLAVFGALHLSAAQGLMAMVPSYMPWRLFWAYFVGFALLASSLSIATKIQVRWSGLLFGMHDVYFCGDDGSSRDRGGPSQSDQLGASVARAIVRLRRLDSCREHAG